MSQRRSTRPLKASTAVILLGLALSDAADARPIPPAKPTPLSRDLEIELALSALPSPLRADATVYTLDPGKGFVIAKQGRNGFTAFVARTGDDTFRGTWPLTAYHNDILYPISFDEAGTKANMRVFFDAAQMQANGMAPEALKL